MIDDEICEDHELIAAHILRFYEDLFGDSRTLKPPLQFVTELIVPSVKDAHN